MEHRDDAGHGGRFFSGGEPDGLHPAATLAQGPMPRGAALAGAVDEVPPGWTFYETARPPPSTRKNPETWGKVPRKRRHAPCGSGKKYKHCHGRVA